MKLTVGQLYDEQHILCPAVAANRDELFRLLAKTLADREDLDEKQIYEGISSRESMMTTLIAPGIALPHAQIAGLGRTLGLLAVVPAGCDYDGKSRITVAALLVDDSEDPVAHQEALKRFALLAKNPRFLDKLSVATSPAQASAVIQRLELTS